MMADLVPMLKHGLYESQCSGDKAGYECGSRSIIGLGMTVMDPAADRMGVCRSVIISLPKLILTSNLKVLLGQ